MIRAIKPEIGIVPKSVVEIGIRGNIRGLDKADLWVNTGASFKH